MATDKINLYLLLIVGIVAFLGITALLLNIGVGTLNVNDNIIGQAIAKGYSGKDVTKCPIGTAWDSTKEKCVDAYVDKMGSSTVKKQETSAGPDCCKYGDPPDEFKCLKWCSQ